MVGRVEAEKKIALDQMICRKWLSWCNCAKFRHENVWFLPWHWHMPSYEWTQSLWQNLYLICICTYLQKLLYIQDL